MMSPSHYGCPLIVVSGECGLSSDNGDGAEKFSFPGAACEAVTLGRGNYERVLRVGGGGRGPGLYRDQ